MDRENPQKFDNSLTGPSGADGPCFYVVWIRPDKITKGTHMRDLLCSRNHAHLIQSSNFWTQPTVHTEYLAIDDGS